MKTLSVLAIVGILSTPLSAFAGSDPACHGKDQGICDTLGAMLNLQGKGCYKMMSVTPAGNGTYRITCVVSSGSSQTQSYTIRL